MSPTPGRTVALALPALLLLAGLMASDPARAADRAHPFRLPQVVRFEQMGVTSIVAADFRHMGRQDIVIQTDSDVIAVYRGRADGVLGAPDSVHVVPVGPGMNVLLTGDVDGDGWPDLVLVGGAIHFLRNRGDGTFEPDRTVPWPYGASRPAFATSARDGESPAGARSVAYLEYPPCSLADVTGDGRADLYVGGAELLFPSFGAAGFGSAVSLPTGLRWNLRVGLADVNGDGLADLIALGASPDSVAVRLSLGGLAWGPPVVSVCPGAAAFGDKDGDGRADLWVFGDSTCVGYRGVGDGTFEPPDRLPLRGSRPWAPWIGDLNGDGRPDALVTDYWSSSVPGSVVEYLSTNDGSVRFAGELSTGINPIPLALDYDGDGVPDLATLGYFDGRLELLRGIGGGNFDGPTVYRTGPPSDLAFADLDGDGRADLLVVNQYGVNIFLGTPSGVLTWTQSFPAPTYPDELAVGDLNGDGKLDVVVAGTDDPTSVDLWFAGHGDGTFGPAHWIAGDDGSYSGRVLVADFDGDGHADVMAAGGPTGARIAWGTAAGVLESFASVTLPSGYWVLSPRSGDRPASLVMVGDSVRVTRCGADRKWSVVSSSPTAGNYRAVLGDLDGDGRADLIEQSGVHAFVVQLAVGDGFAPAGASYACGDSTRVIQGLAVGDVDGDGHADVVAGCTAWRGGSGLVTIWYGTGTGGFVDRADFDPGGTMADQVALGDVDGDGRLDLAVASGLYSGPLQASGSDVLVLRNAARPAPPPEIPPAKLALARAWPNPLRGTNTLQVECALPAPGNVRVELIDVQGRRVAERIATGLAAGTHVLGVPASAVRPGVYFVRVTQGGARATRRVAFLE